MKKKDKLTRADIAQAVYDRLLRESQKSEKSGHFTCEDVSFCVSEIFDEMKKALIEGKVIEFRGFGSFFLKKRAAKTNARNPKTGEKAVVQEHNIVVFKAGMDLKQAVRGEGNVSV